MFTEFIVQCILRHKTDNKAERQYLAIIFNVPKAKQNNKDNFTLLLKSNPSIAICVKSQIMT